MTDLDLDKIIEFSDNYKKLCNNKKLRQKKVNTITETFANYCNQFSTENTNPNTNTNDDGHLVGGRCFHHE